MKTRLHYLFIALTLLALGNVARSATITWTNTAGGNWNTANNWNPNQVPGSSDDVLITSNGTYTVTLNISTTIASLTLGGASGKQTLTNDGSALALINPSVVNTNGILSLNGNILSGLTVNGRFNWNGGVLDPGSSLTIATNGVMNILGSVNLYSALTNQGTVNWQSGTIGVYNYVGDGDTGEIWNQAGALWDIQCDQSFNAFVNVQFHNAGTVRKSAGTGTTLIYVIFANAGTVQAQTGTIQFYGGGNLDASYQANAGAAIYFGAGTFTIGSTPNLQGPGAVGVGGGVPIITGTLACPLNFYANSGLNPGSSLTIATNGVMNILGSVNLFGVLTNQGTVNWQSGAIGVNNFDGEGYTGEIWNQAGALWDIQCDQSLNAPYGSGQFHNAGTVRKSAGTGTTLIYVIFANAGTVQAQTGTIQFYGDYTETSSANILFTPGGPNAGSDFGQINFGTAPAFAGQFTISMRNGFRPSPGTSFSVLSYPSATGDLTSMNGLDLGSGLQLVPQLSGTGLTLLAAAYAANAQPSLSVYPTLNGVLLSWPLSYTGWQLDMTTNLATHIWTPVTLAGTNSTIVPRTAQGYFRLESN